MARAKKKFFLRKPVKILLIILGILIIVRLILPSVVLHYANKTLAGMNGYYGHIEDIDIALIRGAYKIDSIYLNKVDTITQKQTSFFSASEIDLSVEWKALFHGSIVGELIFEKPILKFSKDNVEPKDLRNDSTDFRELLNDFMPLNVNRFEVNRGQIQYIDQFSSPAVDIKMTDVNVLALNLKNSYDSAVLLPATVRADADIYEGTLNFNLKLNPLADQPTFDMNAELKNTNLVLLNDFFQAYANLDVNKGTFGMYAEVAAKQGAFTGYVKPIVQGLDVYGPEDKKDNIFRKIWEGLAGGASEVLENQPKDQFATKIPFEGRLDDPKANIWVTITNVLQNAFINALQPSIDNDIGSVEKKKKEKKTLLQRVFGKKDDEEKDARKKARQKRHEKKKDE